MKGTSVMDQQATTALAPRAHADQTLRRVQDLAATIIRTPQDLAERIRAMQDVAHILSPAVAVSSIAAGWKVDTAVVVIDTKLDGNGGSESGDVYYQPSIHRKRNVNGEYVPEEVSLSKIGLAKLQAALGIEITRSARTNSDQDQYKWDWIVEGTITDFNGVKRRLMPGNASLDLRDGSADIGEWTPAEWALRVAAAEERKKGARENERWKIKPEPINGYTAERVMGMRRFGPRIVATEALNRLIRAVGVKQKYSIAELEKPFVIYRCSPDPDMSDPAVRQIVTAAQFGSLDMLYGRRESEPAALPPAVEEKDTAADSLTPSASSTTTTAPTASAAASASALPLDAQDFDDLPAPSPTTPTTYRIATAKLVQRESGPLYFFVTQEGPTFLVTDRELAVRLNEARKAGTALSVDTNAVTFEGASYLEVIELRTSASPAAGLPDKSAL